MESVSGLVAMIRGPGVEEGGVGAIVNVEGSSVSWVVPKVLAVADLVTKLTRGPNSNGFRIYHIYKLSVKEYTENLEPPNTCVRSGLC